MVHETRHGAHTIRPHHEDSNDKYAEVRFKIYRQAGLIMATGYRQWVSLLDHWANHWVPQMLGTVISIVAMGLGLSMFIDPSVYIETDTFNLVFSFASPYAWGTVFIFTALVVLVTVYTSQKNAQAPLFVMGATYSAFGLLTIPQIVEGSVPSAMFMYIGMAWICLITQLICGVAPRRIPNEKAPFNN
jgi:hypothetical protein